MTTENRERFVTSATKRVNNTIRCIRSIGSLSNKANYEYTDDDIKKIVKAITGELNKCKKRFKLTNPEASDEGFKLD